MFHNDTWPKMDLENEIKTDTNVSTIDVDVSGDVKNESTVDLIDDSHHDIRDNPNLFHHKPLPGFFQVTFPVTAHYHISGQVIHK